MTVWRIDGLDVTLESGQHVFIKRGIVHGFRNDTTAPATWPVLPDPGRARSGYFREMAALLADGTPPDPAKMKETMLRYGLVPAPAA